MDAIQKSIRALETGAKTFRWYQELHAAKPDPEKAARNAEFAVIMEEALTTLREYRDENARLWAIISQVEYLIGKGLHEMSVAYSPDDMRIAGRAEMQLALNVISGEALKGKE